MTTEILREARRWRENAQAEEVYFFDLEKAFGPKLDAMSKAERDELGAAAVGKPAWQMTAVMPFTARRILLTHLDRTNQPEVVKRRA